MYILSKSLFKLCVLLFTQAENFNPITPIIIKLAESILRRFAGSLKKTIPIMKVPTAPIHVHTAYAVPIGIYFCAVHRNYPLAAIESTPTEIHKNFCSVTCESLNPSGQPISKTPATIKYIQAIHFFRLFLY